MTQAELEREVTRLNAENEALKAKANGARKFTLKVSEKGAISAYGTGRFPTTLYQEQWSFILAHKDDILAFIKAHQAELKVKGQDDFVAA